MRRKSHGGPESSSSSPSSTRTRIHMRLWASWGKWKCRMCQISSSSSVFCEWSKGDTRCWYDDNTYAQFTKWICGANSHKLWWRRWRVVGVVVEHFFGVTWKNVYKNDSHDATVISHTFLSYLIYTTTAKVCTRGDVSAAVPDLRWCLFVYYRRADCWTISLATDDDDDDIFNRNVRKTSYTRLHHLVRGIDIDFQSLGISRIFLRTSQ